jgi:hypothetical protein
MFVVAKSVDWAPVEMEGSPLGALTLLSGYLNAPVEMEGSFFGPF